MTSLLNWISIGNNERYFKRQFRGFFWGYPDLFDKLCKDLRPALAKTREERYKKEKEAEGELVVSIGHADNGPIESEVTGQDKHDTTHVPPQSSQIVPLDNEPGSLDVTVDARPDCQGQPDGHPPTLDEHALCVGPGNTEALERSSGDSIPQSETVARSTAPNEIEEVLSTMESENE